MNLKNKGKFQGGIKFNMRKGVKPAFFAEPKMVVLSLIQQPGILLKPLVSKGDKVLLGQKIAESREFDSVPLHSSVSGKISNITEFAHPLLNEKVDSIIIESDGKNIKEPPKKLYSEFFRHTPLELLSVIREAGVLGLGGEGFPTHIKLNKGKKDADTFIINAVESSPYINCDASLILENAKTIIEGIKIVMHILDVSKAVIALRKDDRTSFEIFNKLIFNEPNIFISRVSDKYPQGEERILVKTILGREVRHDDASINEGVIVNNIATVYAIGRIIKNGENLTSRLISVSALKNSNTVNVRVKNGTLVSELIDFCKIDDESLTGIVIGNALRGRYHNTFDIPLIKANRGVFFLSKTNEINYENAECKRCGSCVKVCPVGLIPNKISDFINNGKKEKLKDYMPFACIECGSCSFVCPQMRSTSSDVQKAKNQFSKENERGKYAFVS